MPDVSDVREIIHQHAPSGVAHCRPILGQEAVTLTPVPFRGRSATRTAYVTGAERFLALRDFSQLFATPQCSPFLLFRPPCETFFARLLRLSIPVNYGQPDTFRHRGTVWSHSFPSGDVRGVTATTQGPAWWSPRQPPLSEPYGADARRWGAACVLPGVMYPGTNYGDSQDEGLQRCRPRVRHRSTCGPTSSRPRSASRREPCVDGAGMARALTLFRRVGLCATGPRTSIPGHAPAANPSPTRNADATALPCQGEPPRQLKVRRGRRALDPLATRTTLPREVPVPYPTLALVRPLRATVRMVTFPTSCLMSASRTSR